jgi:hypothetical protein
VPPQELESRPILRKNGAKTVLALLFLPQNEPFKGLPVSIPSNEETVRQDLTSAVNFRYGRPACGPALDTVSPHYNLLQLTTFFQQTSRRIWIKKATMSGGLVAQTFTSISWPEMKAPAAYRRECTEQGEENE